MMFDGDDCLSIRDGVLFVEACSTLDLASRFGTPLYVISEDQLRRNVRAFQSEFQRAWPDGEVLIMPSIKANHSLALRRILTEEGAGCDTFGAAELHAALTTGVPPDRISFNGSSKSPELIAKAVAAGVRVTLDSEREAGLAIEAAAATGCRAFVRVRVRPDFDFDAPSEFFGDGTSLREASQRYKPGIPTEQLVPTVGRLLDADGVDLTGVMMHAGRHTADLDLWREIMRRFARLVGELRDATGWTPREIDVGGGFAVPRDPFGRADPRRRHAPDAPSVAAYADAIAGAVRSELARLHVPSTARLDVEPGRALYGDAGIHLATVKNVKRQSRPIARTWIETDTSEAFLPDINIELNRWTVFASSRLDEPANTVGDVVGISCGFDMVVPDAVLPEVAEGDVLAFLDTGAYQDAGASNFNAMPRPATVLVSGDTAEVIKRAETIEDVFSRDRVPERLMARP